jgi:hypothetical protein
MDDVEQEEGVKKIKEVETEKAFDWKLINL